MSYIVSFIHEKFIGYGKKKKVGKKSLYEREERQKKYKKKEKDKCGKQLEKGIGVGKKSALKKGREIFVKRKEDKQV